MEDTSAPRRGSSSTKPPTEDELRPGLYISGNAPKEWFFANRRVFGAYMWVSDQLAHAPRYDGGDHMEHRFSDNGVNYEIWSGTRKRSGGDGQSILWLKNTLTGKQRVFWMIEPRYPPPMVESFDLRTGLPLPEAATAALPTPTDREMTLRTLQNRNFREVIYTLPECFQIVVMNVTTSLPRETHDNTTQVFLIKHGNGLSIVGDREEHVGEGSFWVVPPGTEHALFAQDEIKLLTVYFPPHHAPNRIDYAKPSPVRPY
jgi:mannose-6-phosphate isomerase-like protein (cupin superfamily)